MSVHTIQHGADGIKAVERGYRFDGGRTYLFGNTYQLAKKEKQGGKTASAAKCPCNLSGILVLY